MAIEGTRLRGRALGERHTRRRQRPAGRRGGIRAHPRVVGGGRRGRPGTARRGAGIRHEAALRRAQRRLPEALALLDRALAIDPWGETPSLLLSKARALMELGDYQESISVLQATVGQIDAGARATQPQNRARRGVGGVERFFIEYKDICTRRRACGRCGKSARGKEVLERTAGRAPIFQALWVAVGNAVLGEVLGAQRQPAFSIAVHRASASTDHGKNPRRRGAQGAGTDRQVGE